MRAPGGGGAHPPLGSPLVASKNQCMRGPHHARLSTSYHGSISKVTIRMVNNIMLPCFPITPSNSWAAATGRPHLLASPAHKTSAAMLVSQSSLLRHLPTIYCTRYPSPAERLAIWFTTSQVIPWRWCCKWNFVLLIEIRSLIGFEPEDQGRTVTPSKELMLVGQTKNGERLVCQT